MRTKFTGLGTALVTPFTKSGAMDEKAVRRLGRRQIDSGTHFLVPLVVPASAATAAFGNEATGGGEQGDEAGE